MSLITRLIHYARQMLSRSFTIGLIFAILCFSAKSFSRSECANLFGVDRDHQAMQEWQLLEKELGKAKNLTQVSNIEVGKFPTVKENLSRQQSFLNSTLLFARQKLVESSPLEKILERINKALQTESLRYADLWLIHFAMQEVADFDFRLKTEERPALDKISIDYVLEKLADARFDFAQIDKNLPGQNSIQRSMGLIIHYTDFDNARYSPSRKLKTRENERIPIPFFQRGFDIVGINQLARFTRIRPVEIISGIDDVNSNGEKILKAPMIDNRPMGIGKDASDHDFNHLGFEVSAEATRHLGEIIFEGSENLSWENQIVLNVIYFEAWHEWGINLSTYSSEQAWELLLNPSRLRDDMSNQNYFGGDPNVLKSISAIDSTIEFLKKKKLPSFWEQ